MLKQCVTGTDFNGNAYTQDLYFNLSKTDLLRMNADGELSAAMERLQSEDVKGSDVLNFIDDLVMKSYGIKSDDGKRFMKSREISEEFMQTDAYSEFVSSLIADTGKLTEFVNGIIPADYAARAAENAATVAAVKPAGN